MGFAPPVRSWARPLSLRGPRFYDARAKRVPPPGRPDIEAFPASPTSGLPRGVLPTRACPRRSGTLARRGRRESQSRGRAEGSAAGRAERRRPPPPLKGAQAGIQGAAGEGEGSPRGPPSAPASCPAPPPPPPWSTPSWCTPCAPAPGRPRPRPRPSTAGSSRRTGRRSGGRGRSPGRWRRRAGCSRPPAGGVPRSPFGSRPTKRPARRRPRWGPSGCPRGASSPRTRRCCGWGPSAWPSRWSATPTTTWRWRRAPSAAWRAPCWSTSGPSAPRATCR